MFAVPFTSVTFFVSTFIILKEKMVICKKPFEGGSGQFTKLWDVGYFFGMVCREY